MLSWLKQVVSLHGNVQEMQGKNTTLQSSLDSTRNQYTEQQKSLQYQNYYKEEQDTLAAVSQENYKACLARPASQMQMYNSKTTPFVYAWMKMTSLKRTVLWLLQPGKRCLMGSRRSSRTGQTPISPSARRFSGGSYRSYTRQSGHEPFAGAPTLRARPPYCGIRLRRRRRQWKG